MNMEYVDTGDLSVEQYAITLLRNSLGEPISPVTSLNTIFESDGLFKDFFNDVDEKLQAIVGEDGILDGSYNIDDIIAIILELLDALSLSKIKIIKDKDLPAVEDRVSIFSYLKVDTNNHEGVYNRRICGIRTDLENNTIERIGESDGKTDINQFLDILPCAGRRRCLINPDNGKVLAYEGDTLYNDNNIGLYDSFVEIPMFYYRRTPLKLIDSTLYKFEDCISYDPVDGYNIFPLFVDPEDGYVYDNIYISTYVVSEENGKCISKPNKPILRNKSLEEFRSMIKSRSKFYNVVCPEYFFAEQLLYSIASGNYDSRGTIGYPSGVEYTNTGICKDMGVRCGLETINGNSNVNFFGVEGLYGYVWQVADSSMYVNNKYVYYGIDHNVEYDTKSKGTVSDSSYSNKYFSTLLYDYNYDFMFLPQSITDTHNNSLIKDSVNGVVSDGLSNIFFGGCQGESSGIFSSYIGLDDNAVSSTRIMYRPRKG